MHTDLAIFLGTRPGGSHFHARLTLTLNFTGVTDGYDKPGFDVVKAVKAFMKKLNTFLYF